MSDKFTLGFSCVDDPTIAETGLLIDADDLIRHTSVIGQSGSGKSVTIKKLIQGAQRSGAGVLVLDVLGDLAGVADARTDSAKLVEVAAERDLVLEDPKGLPTVMWGIERGAPLRIPLNTLSPTMLAALVGAHSLPMRTLIDSIVRYHGADLLTLDDLKLMVRRASIHGVGPTMPAAATCNVVLARIESVQDRINGLFGRGRFQLSDIAGSGEVHVLDVRPFSPTDMKTSLASLAGVLMEMAKDLPESDGLELLIVIDEASKYFKSADATRRSVLRSLEDPFADALQGLRKKGVGIVVGGQSPDHIPDFVHQNSGTCIQHQIPGSQITNKLIRALVGGDITSAMAETTLRNLKVGQAIVTSQDGSFPIDVVPPACGIAAKPESISTLLDEGEAWFQEKHPTALAKVHAFRRRLIG